MAGIAVWYPRQRATPTWERGIESGAPVGILDWLKQQMTEQEQGRLAIAIDDDVSAATFHLTSGVRPGNPVARARWYGPGEPAEVAGFVVPGGMVYVGSGLRSISGGIEPSLIDPARKVSRRNPDSTGQHVNFWPAYHTIPPSSRSAYLAWLANGRRDPGIPVGYVLLFIYGLERRVLIDISEDMTLRPELPAIRAEMVALLDRYGTQHYMLRDTATEFIGLIDLVMNGPSIEQDAPAPPLNESTWVVPQRLRIGLGQFAMRRQPIPATWALAWGWYDPNINLRTPATRCVDEFSRLFAIRYRETHGDGLVVRPGKRRVSVHYRPANFGLGSGALRMDDIPDVFASRATSRKIDALISSVTVELDAYSRWTGGYAERAKRLAAVARLPPVLVDDSLTAIKRFRSWARAELKGEPHVVLDGTSLIAQWASPAPARLSKSEATAMANLFQIIGFGIEPDVRLGGQPVAAQRPVVLFRLGPAAAGDPSPVYAAATVFAQLAALLLGADGSRTPRDVPTVAARIGASFSLSDAAKVRLDAHLAWLWGANVTLAGLKRRVEPLDDVERSTIGDGLIEVATGSGEVTPARVTILQKIYRLLELDQDMVPSHLHASMTGQYSRPARHPNRDGSAGPRPSGNGEGRGFALDAGTIQQREADSLVVSDLLGRIFDEPDDAHLPPAVATAAPPDRPSTGSAPEEDAADDEAIVAGLDRAHSRLLRELLTRDAWNRVEFDDLVARFQLMPEAARDVLNEAALDAVEEPLLEGNDDLTINRVAVRELVP